MPTYEYECRQCLNRFEMRCGFNDDPLASCPKCEGEARRLFSPVPVIFKGSGFYTTDHRSPEPADSGETPKESKDSKEAAAANGDGD